MQEPMQIQLLTLTNCSRRVSCQRATSNDNSPQQPQRRNAIGSSRSPKYYLSTDTKQTAIEKPPARERFLWFVSLTLIKEMNSGVGPSPHDLDLSKIVSDQIGKEPFLLLITCE